VQDRSRGVEYFMTQESFKDGSPLIAHIERPHYHQHSLPFAAFCFQENRLMAAFHRPGEM
jgi:hypothetical protein